MHEYLMEAQHYFLGARRFQVEANDRDEALMKGQTYMKSLLDKDNFIHNDDGSYVLKVVKKLKPSFGKE